MCPSRRPGRAELRAANLAAAEGAEVDGDAGLPHADDEAALGRRLPRAVARRAEVGELAQRRALAADVEEPPRRALPQQRPRHLVDLVRGARLLRRLPRPDDDADRRVERDVRLRLRDERPAVDEDEAVELLEPQRGVPTRAQERARVAEAEPARAARGSRAVGGARGAVVVVGCEPAREHGAADTAPPAADRRRDR